MPQRERCSAPLSLLLECSLAAASWRETLRLHRFSLIVGPSLTAAGCGRLCSGVVLARAISGLGGSDRAHLELARGHAKRPMEHGRESARAVVANLERHRGDGLTGRQ